MNPESFSNAVPDVQYHDDILEIPASVSSQSTDPVGASRDEPTFIKKEPRPPRPLMTNTALSDVVLKSVTRTQTALSVALEAHRVAFARFACEYYTGDRNRSDPANPASSASALLAAFEARAGVLAVPTASKKAKKPAGKSGAPPKPKPKPAPPMAARCASLTTKGAQCRNNAKAGGTYCATHSKSPGANGTVDTAAAAVAETTSTVTANPRSRKRLR